MGIWDGICLHWSLQWRRSLFRWEQETLNSLLNCLNNAGLKANRQDKALCMLDNSNLFSCKSSSDKAHSHLFPQMMLDDVISFICQKTAPPRAELVVWFLVHNRLKTGDYLAKLNIISSVDNVCYFCRNSEETIPHVFFSCPFSWQIWTHYLNWWGVRTALQTQPIELIRSWKFLVQQGFKRQNWSSFIFCDNLDIVL